MSTSIAAGVGDLHLLHGFFKLYGPYSNEVACLLFICNMIYCMTVNKCIRKDGVRLITVPLNAHPECQLVASLLSCSH